MHLHNEHETIRREPLRIPQQDDAPQWTKPVVKIFDSKWTWVPLLLILCAGGVIVSAGALHFLEQSKIISLPDKLSFLKDMPTWSAWVTAGGGGVLVLASLGLALYKAYRQLTKKNPAQKRVGTSGTSSTDLSGFLQRQNRQSTRRIMRSSKLPEGSGGEGGGSGGLPILADLAIQQGLRQQGVGQPEGSGDKDDSEFDSVPESRNGVSSEGTIEMEKHPREEEDGEGSNDNNSAGGVQPTPTALPEAHADDELVVVNADATAPPSAEQISSSGAEEQEVNNERDDVVAGEGDFEKLVAQTSVNPEKDEEAKELAPAATPDSEAIKKAKEKGKEKGATNYRKDKAEFDKYTAGKINRVFPGNQTKVAAASTPKEEPAHIVQL